MIQKTIEKMNGEMEEQEEIEKKLDMGLGGELNELQELDGSFNNFNGEGIIGEEQIISNNNGGRRGTLFNGDGGMFIESEIIKQQMI